ncbi:hypothetical protein NE237_025304 [Protea cynaroides]|uniref:DUF547 domain-containing protein n=1 Tax=Protea cynaroides TaxID=273540 RepID=A0A9Q0H4M9_9MAGN|nr:hypothetical protein NE237_025304 [Protea cynaroides]
MLLSLYRQSQRFSSNNFKSLPSFIKDPIHDPSIVEGNENDPKSTTKDGSDARKGVCWVLLGTWGAILAYMCLLQNIEEYTIDNMVDSTVLHFPFNFRGETLVRSTQIAGKNCNSEDQFNLVNEFRNCNAKIEVSNSCGETGSPSSCNKSNSTTSYRVQLEQDVQILEECLREEMKLHAVLENAIEHDSVSSSKLSCLPPDAEELLSNIAMLEVSVSKLEQEMVSLHFQLSQERNERRLAEYHLKHSPSQSLYFCSPKNVEEQNSSSLTCYKHSMFENSELHVTREDISCLEQRDQQSEATRRSSNACSTTGNVVDSRIPVQDKKVSRQMFQHVEGKLTKGMHSKGLWKNPNQLSEEMVRCMRNIFISLVGSSVVSSNSSTFKSSSSPLSPHGQLSNSLLSSVSECSTIPSRAQSPQVDMQCNAEVLATENACDPYRVRGKLCWADIGTYGSAVEVSWMSVGKKQLEYAAGALRRFRSLVEQLAKVNPTQLSTDEKLAFWINLYNALIMHAYLAYGVPRSDLKLFSLMQKAAYTVGGHSFNAAAIEYVILKMKPPVHRPQIALLLALHKLKVSEEQRKFSIDTFEPLVVFALSCGMYSSPAVKVYTAKNVREELQEAQRDFIRASVGVSSKGKLLVPKMLHCFARGSVDDSNLAVWISRYLQPHQAAFVEQCMSQRRQSFLGSRNCGILPFDSHFRYLFLRDEIPP